MTTTKKNILFLSSWYPNKNAPTLGNFVQKHAEAAALYNNVFVIASFSHASKEYLLVESESNQVKEYVVYYPKVTTKLPIVKQWLQYIRTKKALLKAYAKLNERTKIDLVHLNVAFPLGFFAVYLKQKYKIPFVVTEHSTAFQIGSSKMPKFSMKMAIRTMNQANFVLPVSKDLENALKQRSVTSKTQVISNVVNEEIFLKYPLKSPESNQFIHISTAIDSHKNVSGIIRCIAALLQTRNDFQFKIISDGDLAPFIYLAYQELSIPTSVLFFEGIKTTEEIAFAIHESKSLVLFSNFENFPCVIPESFMLGKPVISTAINGIPEHVNGSNGILISVNNEVELQHAMMDILDGNTHFDAAEIREYAINNFSYTAVGKAFDDVYIKILTGHDS